MEFSFQSFKRCLSSGVLLAAALPVFAAPASAAICEYVIGNEWSTGYSAEIVITNNTSTTINQREVSWAYTNGDAMSNGWNATTTGSNPYQATPLSWNSTIAPSGWVAFGVNVQKVTAGSSTTAVNVTGDVCSDDWSSLCQESISLDTTMRAYTIECGLLSDSDGDNNVKVDFTGLDGE